MFVKTLAMVTIPTNIAMKMALDGALVVAPF